MKKIDQKRILIVDDNPDIHADFNKILNVESNELQIITRIEEEIFGDENQDKKNTTTDLYQIDSAFQGQEALEIVRKSIQDHQPYALAFVDVRMPPGWDGIETIQNLWSVDPNIQIVICTAYADYSWKEIVQKLENSNNFLILKKPFDVIEIRQLVFSLIKKWELAKQVEYQINNLQDLVDKRTAELEQSLSLTRATLESIPEGIIAIGHDRKTIIYNKTFIKLWDISESTLKNEKSFIIFQKLAKQVEESHLFLKVMNDIIYKSNINENIKEWKLKDGRTYEYYSQPQINQNKIIGTVICFRDITERKQLEDEILYQSTHDQLTGLPNKILLEDRLERAITYAKRNDTLVGVILIDLDNFKEINTSLGHGCGDELLTIVAQRIKKSLRDIDTAVRIGGDKFAVILVEQKKAEEILVKVKEISELFKEPYIIENHHLTITSSIGVAVYPHDGKDARSLVKNSDAALYHAKTIGKNTYQIYMTEFNEYLLQKAELFTALQKAIQRNEFVLHFQPLVTSATNEIIGVECLVRWQHPTMGMLYPQTFIDLAEESGLIVPIGKWVLRSACLQMKIWNEKLKNKICIAVNVSAYQLIQKDFVQMVESVLKETGLNPQYLELEMTESHIFKNIQESAEKLKKLKDLGIHLSIDDFGTGYASFTYLKHFPFDKIKIDKSFINGIHLNSNDDAIVEAIITMGKKMGITVLAEGVEKKEQIDFIQKHHGNQMQGYFYSGPVNAEQCERMLLEQNTRIKTQ